MTRHPVKHILLETDVIEVISAFDACHLCNIQIEFVHALVMEGVFDFAPDDPSRWTLDSTEFALLRRATRLHQDLGINPPGVALALELLHLLERAP